MPSEGSKKPTSEVEPGATSQTHGAVAPMTAAEAAQQRLYALVLPDDVRPEHVGTSKFSYALSSILDELLAMDRRRLQPMNVDLSAACRTVLGVLPRLRMLRPEMVVRFGEQDASAVDRLELLAHAASQARAVHAAAETSYDLRALATAASETRAALLAEVASLGARKLVAPKQLAELSRRSGYKNVGFDLPMLVAFFQKHWETIEKATGYEMEDLDRAEGLASQLITAAGVNAQVQHVPSADIRQRAYSLLYATYDRVRRMVGYLRWEERDADDFAPSLHRTRRKSRKALAVENE